MTSDVALPACVVAGINDATCLRDGWHERERDGRCGIAYRAAGERGALEVGRQASAGRLWCLISGPRGLAEEALQGEIIIGGQSHKLQLDADLWVLRSFPLPEGEPGAPLRIELRLPDPPCPDRVLHNGDGRRLGWFVSALWQE